ncbi:hypothetical protein AVEN_118741-1 [Araneus ventricosus]|uniref:Uncharacterized protein n=1 Tax=Araneus ventricosus TaxID=182803 RepID=A0A4Y2BXI8_ARAVE|nr:hypothetical protein AVEN_118741-1 [Araneus ventricosus]
MMVATAVVSDLFSSDIYLPLASGDALQINFFSIMRDHKMRSLLPFPPPITRSRAESFYSGNLFNRYVECSMRAERGAERSAAVIFNYVFKGDHESERSLLQAWPYHFMMGDQLPSG